MTKQTLSKQQIDQMVLQERQQRETECAKEFDATLQQLLEKYNCELDVQTIISGHGIQKRFVFIAK